MFRLCPFQEFSLDHRTLLRAPREHVHRYGFGFGLFQQATFSDEIVSKISVFRRFVSKFQFSAEDQTSCAFQSNPKNKHAPPLPPRCFRDIHDVFPRRRGRAGDRPDPLAAEQAPPRAQEFHPQGCCSHQDQDDASSRLRQYAV